MDPTHVDACLLILIEADNSGDNTVTSSFCYRVYVVRRTLKRFVTTQASMSVRRVPALSPSGVGDSKPRRARRPVVASRLGRIILAATYEFRRITRSLATVSGVQAGDNSNCRHPGVVHAFSDASWRSAAEAATRSPSHQRVT